MAVYLDNAELMMLFNAGMDKPLYSPMLWSTSNCILEQYILYALLLSQSTPEKYPGQSPLLSLFLCVKAVPERKIPTLRITALSILVVTMLPACDLLESAPVNNFSEPVLVCEISESIPVCEISQHIPVCEILEPVPVWTQLLRMLH